MGRLLKHVVITSFVLSAAYGIYYLSWSRYLTQSYALANRPSSPLNVQVEPVTFGPISRWVQGEGISRALTRETLSFQASGRVLALGQHQGREIKEGDRIEKGALLGELDPREARQDVLEARARVNRATREAELARIELKRSRIDRKLRQSNFSRAEKLVRSQAVSKMHFDREKALVDQAVQAVLAAENRLADSHNQEAEARAHLEKAQIRMEKTRITAPFSGVIARIHVRKGDYISPVDSPPPAFILIDPSVHEIIVDLPLVTGRDVAPGQRAEIFANLPSQIHYGPARVHSVSPMLSPDSRAIRVKLRTKGDSQPRDGEPVKLKICTGHRPRTLVLSRNSLLYRQGNPYVFVLDPDFNIVTRRPVVLGFQDRDRVEIRSGLKADTRVVTDGRHLLMEGLEVNPLEK